MCDSQRAPSRCLGCLLLFPLLARIGNLRRRGQAAPNSRFSEAAFWSILDASCFSFLSSRESEIYGGRGQAVQNSRFSGIVSSRALWTLLHSPCENRGFVDRGLGGVELVILREDFSGEGKLLFRHSNLSSAIR